MAIKINSVKCPACGANIQVEEGKERIFCTYCGTQILITNENEYIYRNIDEAKIREVEAKKMLELKKLEMIEKKRAAAEKAKKNKIIMSIIIAVIGIILLRAGAGPGVFFGLIFLEGIIYLLIMNDNNIDVYLGDKVRVPFGISDYCDKNYVAIEEMFRASGFTNIRCVPLNDLRLGLLKKVDTVESIMVNGKEIMHGGKKFSPNVPVLISYHSFGGR